MKYATEYISSLQNTRGGEILTAISSGRPKGEILNALLKQFGFKVHRVSSDPLFEYRPPIDIKPEVISEILDFHSTIGILYERIDESVPQYSKVGPAWTQHLKNERPNQIEALENRNTDRYENLLKNMFFNEMTSGIGAGGINWRGQLITQRVPEEFFLALDGFRTISDEELPIKSANHWPMWGYFDGDGIIKLTDPDHCTQAYNIHTVVSEDHNSVADIGSGYGGTMEKLAMWSEKPLNMFLIDIPLNLTTAFGYLSHLFDEEDFTLVAKKEDLQNLSLSDNRHSFVFVPSVYADSIGREMDVVHNARSFSEMNKETVDWYISLFLEEYECEYLIETNVNKSSDQKYDGRDEVLAKDYNIPESHTLVSRSAYTAPKITSGGSFTRRYVTSIYRRTSV